MLLADIDMDLPYTFVQLNNAMSHVPLMNEGHISTDRWCTQCGHPQLASSTTGMQTVAAQGQGSVLRVLTCGARDPTVHLPRASPLGCGSSQ